MEETFSIWTQYKFSLRFINDVLVVKTIFDTFFNDLKEKYFRMLFHSSLPYQVGSVIEVLSISIIDWVHFSELLGLKVVYL